MSRNRNNLTDRQQQALTWMARVGKASERAVRAHGFTTSTLDVLVKAGLVERRRAWRSVPPQTVYYTR